MRAAAFKSRQMFRRQIIFMPENVPMVRGIGDGKQKGPQQEFTEGWINLSSS